MNSKSKKTRERKGKTPRNIQLQHIEAGFNSPGTPAYEQAWTEFKELFDGLIADENFWQTRYMLPLLPHLVNARKEIDRLK
jgi:hypothetical protein